MTSDQARRIYLGVSRLTPIMVALCDEVGACRLCDRLWLDVDAASIRLDLVCAEEAKRRTVAW